MPDLEVLVCGGGSADGKVSCETMIAGEGPPAAEEDPDLPAESFELRIGDEIGWVDINAVYDREDSTKGLSNPKSHQHHQKPPASGSQRFSGSLAAPKAHIIGLPNKIQHSGYVGHSARRPAKGLIFPKVAAGAGGGGRKTAVPESEPTSPKVSCFGKVLSERERERERCRRRHQGLAEAEHGGCWASLAAFFRCGEVEQAEEPITSAPPAGSMTSARPSLGNEAMVVPPGLGGMRQFASRRRPASWGGDVDVEVEVEGHVAWSGPLDREEMRGRRSVGSLEDAVGRRDW